MRFTLKDVTDFCWKHKKARGFKNYTYEQIADHIIEKAAEGALHYVKDDHGICAVCTVSDYGDRLYIHHIVGIRTGFATLVRNAGIFYPGRTILGQRGEKLTTFNDHLLWAMTHQALVVQQDKS